MPRKPKPWFRFYVEALRDRKIRRLSHEHKWLWVTCLSISRESPQPGVLLTQTGQPITTADLADEAQLTPRKVKVGIQHFIEQEMIAVDSDTRTIRISKWDKRQYESDKRDGKEQKRSVKKSIPSTESPTESPPEGTSNGTKSVPKRAPSSVGSKGVKGSTDREVLSEPTDSPEGPSGTPNAGTILTNALKGQPKQSERYRGNLGQQIKNMLKEGLDPDAIEKAATNLVSKGQSPSSLPTFYAEMVASGIKPHGPNGSHTPFRNAPDEVWDAEDAEVIR